jgi:flavin-dependent dehydrogenase
MRFSWKRSAILPCRISRDMLPVIVIGGGPSGSICARRLAARGHRVALFEKRTERRSSPLETCTPRTRLTIEAACGCAMPSDVATPLEGFWSAWGTADFEQMSFGFWQAVPGAVFQRTALDAWLLHQAERVGAVVYRGCQVIAGYWNGRTWSVKFRCGDVCETMDACFVVEAAGALGRSPVQPSTARYFFDNLICLSAMTSCLTRTASFAGVEACSSGWWYTADIGTRDLTISFFTDADLSPAKMRNALFCDALQQTIHIRQLMGASSIACRVKPVGCRTSIRNQIWRDCWLAIGDAARTIDPLSGGGVARAITDGVDAADAISIALTRSDFGPLRAFAVQRANSFFDNLEVQREYYSRESRWQVSEFWRRRTEPLSGPSESRTRMA